MRRIWEVGVASSPVIGRRRGPGLRASSDGVLATKKRTHNVSEYMLVLALCLVITVVTVVIWSSLKCAFYGRILGSVGPV